MNKIKLEDGEKLFYRDQGQGTPVILIHGWPVNADMWEYQVPALLKAGYRVISYDRRGFGRSTHCATGYDYNTLASDLRELINQLELQSVALVGFSMGGGEIARYLTKYGSERVSKVALISSVVPYMLKTQDNPNGVDEKMFEQIKAGLANDRPHFLAGFAKDFYGQGALVSAVSAEILQWTLQMALPASPVATIECVDAFGKTDFRSDLKAFKNVPTLIIHGTADKTVPITTAGEAAAKALPHARFVKYDGAAHGLFVTHKEQLCADLLSFLQGNVRADLAPKSNDLGVQTTSR